MNRIDKFLARLNKEQLAVAKLLLRKIERSDFVNLRIKKLVGHHDLYRIREGRIRAIFRILQNGKTETISLDFKNDNTYKNL